MLQIILAYLVIFYQLSTAFSTNFGQYDLVAKENNDGTTRFFIVSDWGGLPISPFDTPSEVAVADAMGKLGVKLNTTFRLALGDNFYYDGIRAVNNSRFQNTFEHVFSVTSLQTSWYVLAGNHAHRGNVSAEIEYGKTSKRCDKQTKLIDFVMIDTVVFCGGGGLSDWDHTPLEGPKNQYVAEAYWQWIEEQLHQSTIPYLLVNGHYPVYSIAEHGPTRCLIDRLRPLLHQYHVTAYMCGHDHNLQHLTNDMDEVHMNYFVVGAANFIDSSQEHAKDVPADSLKFFWAGSSVYGGFALMEHNPTHLSLSFIDHSKQILYQAIMTPHF
ncbi:unnamed protein product [Rotaria sordida]|uniref:Tartrate-resistant acid phosphatase type 5 n=1 Tax=Rotaria sordida TaxID=392033 RepID=A0A814TN42_9BILA|nr:unnamed protein product [Rotaria sordida]CAF3492875.1 unnamed protein product [Rotaria sordida]